MKNSQLPKKCFKCGHSTEPVWRSEPINFEQVLNGKVHLIHGLVSVCNKCGFQTLSQEQAHHLHQAAKELYEATAKLHQL